MVNFELGVKMRKIHCFNHVLGQRTKYQFTIYLELSSYSVFSTYANPTIKYVDLYVASLSVAQWREPNVSLPYFRDMIFTEYFSQTKNYFSNKQTY